MEEATKENPEMTGGGRAWAVAVLLGVLMATGFVVAPAANAQSPTDIDCTGNLGDPVFGSAEWDEADLNNQRCAAAGLQAIQNSPAVTAATAANAAAGVGTFNGDPFRAPHWWAGQRGSYEPTMFKDRNGDPWPAGLFGPLDPEAGPYPGVLLVCHTCGNSSTIGSIWYWAAEALAEAGYVAMYAAVGGNSVPRAIDATDFFVATSDAPTQRGDFNPWHASLDRNRLGILGHSGAAGVALSAGHSDPRYDVIVAWDPAGSYTMAGITPRVPTMIQVADYRQEPVPPARHEKPIPTLPKFTFFDTISAAGVDAMQVALRASTHFEWGPHFPPNSQRPYSIYGEMVARTTRWRGWIGILLYRPTAGLARRPRTLTHCDASPPAVPAASIDSPTCTRSAPASSTRRRPSEPRTPRPATSRSRSVGCPSGTCCRSTTARSTSSTPVRWSARTCEPAVRKSHGSGWTMKQHCVRLFERAAGRVPGGQDALERANADRRVLQFFNDGSTQSSAHRSDK